MSMSMTVAILDGPLPLSAAARRFADAGAVICFEGIVRPTEEGRLLLALDYEAYEPMASKTLGELAEAVMREHGLLAVAVEHSRGRVPVGQCSFRLLIASRHRKEGLAAMDRFIDRMKQDVPIWKKPVYATKETR
jgi:molybdopterin synthase catalytic subunit